MPPKNKSAKAPSKTRAKATQAKASRPTKKQTPKTISKTKEPAQVRKQAAAASRPRASVPSTINQAPDQVLVVLPFGSGDSCELGLGPEQREALVPIINPYLNHSDPSRFHVVHLACGGMHTVALTKNNEIVTWGANDHGALGRNTSWGGGLRDTHSETGDDSDASSEEGELNPKECTPAAIASACFPPGTTFVQVAAGDNCSFALTDTGQVYGWGTFLDMEGHPRFGYSALGKPIKIQPTPVLIPKLQSITQIVCGANHALALDVHGRIWGLGRNEQTQLGRRPLSRAHPDTLIPFEIHICRAKATYIASGEYHAFAVDAADNVWAWGLNSFGQAGYAAGAGQDLGMLDRPMKIPGLRRRGVVVLDGGSHHSVAVTGDGTCLAWGRIDFGQLGIAFTEDQLGDEGTVRRDDIGKPRICLRPTPVVGIGHAVYAACGSGHSIFINKEGVGYATGTGVMGQLGQGNDEDLAVATQLQGGDGSGRVLRWAGAGGQYSVVAAGSQAT